MRLGIDSRDLFARERRGVGKTLSTLIRHLVPLLPEWQINLYSNQRNSIATPASTILRQIDMRGDRFNLWECARLPLAVLTDRLDLLHCPSQTAPGFVSCPVVLTVHDLIPIRIGDGWAEREVARFRSSLARSVKRANRIIAVSEFTKEDLLSAFPIAEGKIDVVSWGIDAHDIAGLGEEAWTGLCQGQGIRQPFFFGFGGDAPRKNILRLLRAFSMFVRETTRDAQLVLSGVSPTAQDRFGKAAAELGLTKQLVLLGYLPDEAVISLLKRAVALVFPSLYEGFGVPILEAMAVGTPVVASNTTSIPEVAGSAALLIDPTDEHAIAEAMRECHLNTRTRDELRTRGLARVKDFNWQQTAAKTAAVYMKAL